MAYPKTSAVQLHHGGRWHTVGDLRVTDHGHGVFSYREDYVFGDLQRPISLTKPVAIERPPEIEGPMGMQPGSVALSMD